MRKPTRAEWRSYVLDLAYHTDFTWKQIADLAGVKVGAVYDWTSGLKVAAATTRETLRVGLIGAGFSHCARDKEEAEVKR